MPAPRPGLDGPEAAAATGACVGSESKVREVLRLAGFKEANVILKKGWFEQSFKEDPHPETIALLHLDCDWYESVLLSLRTFYDRVSEGGTIVLDDFGHWEGCREAFYDFAAERRLKPLLERFGHTQAFWIKGRTHNRDFLGQWEVP
jgi:O-methyltransferase